MRVFVGRFGLALAVAAAGLGAAALAQSNSARPQAEQDLSQAQGPVVIAPKTSITVRPTTVRPGDAPGAVLRYRDIGSSRPCSIPLLSVLPRAVPPVEMPRKTPSKGDKIRYIDPPAPPCDDRGSAPSMQPTLRIQKR